MMATLQGDVLLTAFFLNNLNGTGRSNYIHSTNVAHQTAKWCFDSTASLGCFTGGIILRGKQSTK